MRRRTLLAILCLLLLLILVGWWGIWSWYCESFHTYSSITPASYDYRACRTHPTPAHCDGMMPVAGWDADISASHNGNEVCLDGTTEVADTLVRKNEQTIGLLQLMKTPFCQSYYAHLHIGREVSWMTLELLVRGPHPRAFSSLTKGTSEVSQVTPCLQEAGACP